MLVWALAWPLPAPNEPAPRQRRLIWSSIYALAGAISVGAYFIGYHRPSYHPAFASISARFLDLAHYVVLWSGNYFSTGFASPFLLGIIVLTLFFSGAGFVHLDDLAARRLANILSLASARGVRLRHGHDHGSWAVGLRSGAGARQSLLGVQSFFLYRALWPLLCDLLCARARCFSRRSTNFLPHAYAVGRSFSSRFPGRRPTRKILRCWPSIIRPAAVSCAPWNGWSRFRIIPILRSSFHSSNRSATGRVTCGETSLAAPICARPAGFRR